LSNEPQNEHENRGTTVAMAASRQKLQEVQIGTRDLNAFLTVQDEEKITQTIERAEALSGLIGDRTVWNVNSTAVGGGVAEMLQSMLAFTRGLGIDARWLVIHGSVAFFKLTKRLHHALHGEPGDGNNFGQALFKQAWLRSMPGQVSQSPRCPCVPIRDNVGFALVLCLSPRSVGFALVLCLSPRFDGSCACPLVTMRFSCLSLG
jgi:hypothetical protein